MKYYLGVDGGGSKTFALVVSEQGVVLGKGSSGNGNHQIDYDEAKASIRDAAEEALAAAGITKEQLEFANFGLAGADREADFQILRPMIASLGYDKFEVVCDTMIGLRAGTTKSYGVSVICGTGTNCAGRNEHGRFYQCGGFSYMYGDFGGGGSLCVEVFRSVIRAWDGREEDTLLTGLLLRELGYPSVEAMFGDYLDQEKEVPLNVTKLLFAAAAQGDAVAHRILKKQGEELGKSAVAVIRRLGMEQDSFDVVLAGSIVTRGEGEIVNKYIEEAVLQIAPHAVVKKLAMEPVIGSVWLAMEASGLTVSTAITAAMSGMAEFGAIKVKAI